MAALEANRLWFEAHRKDLAKKFPQAKYVAVWEGKPRAAGNDLFEVAKDFYQRFGYQPMYIGNIFEGPDAEFVSGFVR